MYDLEQIKTMIKEEKVDSSNFKNIIKSLANHSFDDEGVLFILNGLSHNQNIPENYRNLLKDVLNSELVMNKEEKVDNNFTFNEIQENDDVVIVEQNQENKEKSMEDVLEDTDNLSYTIDNSSMPVFAISDYNNEAKMNEIHKLAASKGIKIVDSKVGEHEPVSIALELTPESKPYLDNLLLNLYSDDKNHSNIELKKDNETGKEMLVMSVDGKSLSGDEIKKYGDNLLYQVNNIINNTDKDKDYEALMSPKLRSIKDKFHGDEKNIMKDNDVEFVYSNDEGVNSYHIVADSKEEAKEVADLLDVSIKEDHGGGIFEIDDSKIADIEGTKIAKESKGVNYSNRVKEINDEQGISDLDINYNNKHYLGFNNDDSTNKIFDFIEESKDDYRIISQIEIKNVGSQRIIEMRNANGYNDTVVIHDGKNFDDDVLPKIADSFSKDSEVSGCKTYEENGSVGYFAESDNNTRLIVSDSNEETISKLDETITKNKEQDEMNKSNTNVKTYERKLGAYTSNNSQSANTSFASLLAFCLVMILGLSIIYIIFGG